jgi:acetyl esterase/lipase
MKIIAFFFILIPEIILGQKEIPLYEGLIPNSQKPNIPIDTTLTKASFGNTAIDILHGVTRPTLTIYLPGKSTATGVAVIICPGGSYQVLAVSHEGHDVAKLLVKEGIAAFVLKYRLPSVATMQDKSIGPLQDAQRAIQLVRQNSAKWSINPQKIGIMGSSAGGHLASTAGTHWQVAKIENPGNISLRPDFMILNYPVISFTDSLAHNGSRISLVGPSKILGDVPKDFKALGIDESIIRMYSNELQVNDQTPGTFITSSMADETVPPGNTLYFVAALQQHGIPVELFLYAKGKHGYGMVNPEAKVQWIDRCTIWLRKEEWAKKTK